MPKDPQWQYRFGEVIGASVMVAKIAADEAGE
jgi:hypothetical protein